MKCNHPIEAPACSFHYNGECLRNHNYECQALAKPRYVNANKLMDLAMHEGAYGYVDIYDICHAAAVDVVEVTRCKDCKNAERVRNGVYHCPYDNKNHIGGFYCAYGEKKEEKTDAEVH